MVGTRWTGRFGSRAALAAVLVAVMVGCASTEDAGTRGDVTTTSRATSTGGAGKPPPIDPTEWKVGDCFDTGPPRYEMVRVACTAAHRGQVIAVVPVADRFTGEPDLAPPLKADSRWERTVRPICERELSRVLGSEERDRYQEGHLTPRPEQWRSDPAARDLVCLAVAVGAKTSTPL